ncbi:MAG: hypothetical protein LBP54_05290 [Campylobacteraceae bacterium]|jgi:hypothetical protein|nr:hypothetical protein [Campylobacteraceae bacterium]
MLYAFEWKIYYEDYKNIKQRDNFCKKWGMKNPHEKRLENKKVDYVYKMIDPYFVECISDDSEMDKKEPKRYQFLYRRIHYYNAKYDIHIINKRAQKGFELFGKYFLNLWD